jgi:head-tail adaptor
MRAGELRHRVSVLAPTKTKDAEGVTVDGYAETAKIWAKMEAGGGEYVHRKFGIMDDSISMIMTCRPHSAVVAINHISYQGNEYEIRHIDDTEPGKYVALLKRV